MLRDDLNGKEIQRRGDTCEHIGCPGWCRGKEFAYNAGDAGDEDLIPGLGRPPGEGNSNPFQCSCLQSPMDRGAWRATVHGVAKSQT